MAKEKAKKQEFDVVIPPYEVVEINLRSGEQIQDWGHKLLGANEAYAKTKGEGVIIFILDTAGEFTHPDLAEREIVALRKNFSSSPGLPDLHGHGTHCAGIAAATDNAIGVIGIAPKANLGAVKVLSDQGSGNYPQINSGIRYVADVQLPAAFAGYRKVISMSLGGATGDPQLLEAIKYAIAKGCFVLAAAGNSGNNAPVGYPGAYEEVITVGSIGKTEAPSAFTSSGPAVDVAAPGEGVYSTHKNGSYAYLSGTSMATPQVAGVVALILSAHPEIKTQAHLEFFLEKHAKDIHLPGEDLLTGAGEPYILPYLNNEPGEDPGNPDPPTDPEPPAQREKREVIFPMRLDSMPVVFWRRVNETAMKKALILEIEFTVTTREPTEVAYDRIEGLFLGYVKNRGFIMANHHDLQDVAEWVARFFRILNPNIGEHRIERIMVGDESDRVVEVRALKLANKVALSRLPVAQFTHNG